MVGRFGCSDHLESYTDGGISSWQLPIIDRLEGNG
jgi:hypothetical protein